MLSKVWVHANEKADLRFCNMMGLKPAARIIPFRGQYFHLGEKAKEMVRGLIYPLPDPNFPFLGVHLTRTVQGEVLAGPNAVLSFKREGYTNGDFDIQDAVSTLLYAGFWRFCLQNIGIGAKEYLRTWSDKEFARSIQIMLPEIKASDLSIGRSGVRAQAVSKSGKLVDDFQFEQGENSLHVINAPSPGATASLAIGRHVGAKALNM